MKKIHTHYLLLVTTLTPQLHPAKATIQISTGTGKSDSQIPKEILSIQQKNKDQLDIIPLSQLGTKRYINNTTFDHILLYQNTESVGVVFRKCKFVKSYFVNFSKGELCFDKSRLHKCTLENLQNISLFFCEKSLINDCTLQNNKKTKITIQQDSKVFNSHFKEPYQNSEKEYGLVGQNYNYELRISDSTIMNTHFFNLNFSSNYCQKSLIENVNYENCNYTSFAFSNSFHTTNINFLDNNMWWGSFYSDDFTNQKNSSIVNGTFKGCYFRFVSMKNLTLKQVDLKDIYGVDVFYKGADFIKCNFTNVDCSTWGLLPDWPANVDCTNCNFHLSNVKGFDALDTPTLCTAYSQNAQLNYSQLAKVFYANHQEVILDTVRITSSILISYFFYRMYFTSS